MTKCACGHLFLNHAEFGCRESGCHCTYGTYAQTNVKSGNGQLLFNHVEMMISGPLLDIEFIDKQMHMAFPCYDKNDLNWNKIEILWDEFHGLYEKEEYSKILQVMDKIIQIKPNDQYAYMYKAYAFDELKQYEEAIQCLDTSLEIDNKFTRALHIKGVVLNNLERYTDAIIFFNKALEIDPKYVKALNNKGTSLNNLEKYEEAIVCFDKVLEINPQYSNALNNKGFVLNNLKKYEEAIVWFDKVLDFLLNLLQKELM